MARIDVYLRSIERFGAAGAILTSGQAVTLRFPTGDRHATQVTHHDALVSLVREIAPPIALNMIDRQQQSSFDIDNNGTSYTLTVTPRPGMWQVIIEPADAAAAAPPPPVQATQRPARAQTDVSPPSENMPIERGQYQYDERPSPTTSGCYVL